MAQKISGLSGNDALEGGDITGYSIVAGFTPEEIAEFNRNSKVQNFHKSQSVFDFGRKAEGLYCIKSGVIKVTKPLASGEKVLVQLGASGDVLGSKALLRGTDHHISAHAATDVEIYFLPESFVRSSLLKYPRFNLNLMAKLCAVIEDAEDNLARMASLNVRGRVAQVLSDLGKRFGKPVAEGIQLDVPLSRQELAQLAGTVVESVVRQLGDFKREGLLEVTGRHILILKPTELAQIN